MNDIKKKIAIALLNFAASIVIDYIDQDKDGKITKKELSNTIGSDFEKLYKKIKAR